MSVDSVNNNNKGLYVAGAATIGAGAGVGAAYLTKHYLKDNAPTDEFVKKVADNLWPIQKLIDAETQKINAYQTIGDLQSYIDVNFDNPIDIKNLELDKAKEKVLENLKTEAEKTKNEWSQDIKKCWDSSKKSFVEDLDEEYAKVLKNTAKKIQGKYAAIYGSIGAAVLGLATLLFKSKDS